MANYDITGNIAVIKGEGKTKKELMGQAKELMKKPSITTVVEKIERVRGRLRNIKARHLLGEKNFIAGYTENGCRFKFNIQTCYFSPRLANERLEVAKLVKKLRGKNVLVMFSGAAPFPIVIEKFAKPKRIVAVELGRECCKYARENLKLNKMQGRIELIQGDVKRKVTSRLGKFDIIVMPRPNLKESFLKDALKVSKKGTKIFYYGFCRENELNGVLENLKKEAKSTSRNIKLLKAKKAGDIAPYKFRWRIEIKVLN